VAVCGSVWQCVAVCGSVWQCVAVCGSALQHTVAHCNVDSLTLTHAMWLNPYICVLNFEFRYICNFECRHICIFSCSCLLRIVLLIYSLLYMYSLWNLECLSIWISNFNLIGSFQRNVQKRPRELDHRFRCEIGEISLQMHSAVCMFPCFLYEAREKLSCLCFYEWVCWYGVLRLVGSLES